MVHSARTCALQMFVGVMDFMLCLVSQLFYAVSSVERAADLLISLYKTLELNCEIFVLGEQDVAVVLQCVYFCLNIHVLSL